MTVAGAMPSPSKMDLLFWLITTEDALPGSALFQPTMSPSSVEARNCAGLPLASRKPEEGLNTTPVGEPVLDTLGSAGGTATAL